MNNTDARAYHCENSKFLCETLVKLEKENKELQSKYNKACLTNPSLIAIGGGNAIELGNKWKEHSDILHRVKASVDCIKLYHIECVGPAPTTMYDITIDYYKLIYLLDYYQPGWRTSKLANHPWRGNLLIGNVEGYSPFITTEHNLFDNKGKRCPYAHCSSYGGGKKLPYTSFTSHNGFNSSPYVLRFNLQLEGLDRSFRMQYFAVKAASTSPINQ